jgi:glycosyltransferase involved in cell wall biosynthesis
VNLSDKTQFIETFGMTALETMAAGLPVIVPTEGGIAEMLRDGF